MIEFLFLQCKFWLIVSHGLEEPVAVDKRQEDLTEPGKLFPDNINDELGGEVVANGGVEIEHKGLETLGKGIVGFGREHAHQLLEGFEGFTNVKHCVLLRHINISEEGTVVKGVKPVPTRHALIVVQTHPLQSLHVLTTDTALQLQKFLRLNPELLRVVLLLVRKYVVVEGRVILQTYLRSYTLLYLLLERPQQVVRVDH